MGAACYGVPKKIIEPRKLNEKHRHCLRRDNSFASLFLANKFKVLFNARVHYGVRIMRTANIIENSPKFPQQRIYRPRTQTRWAIATNLRA